MIIISFYSEVISETCLVSSSGWWRLSKYLFLCVKQGNKNLVFSLILQVLYVNFCYVGVLLFYPCCPSTGNTTDVCVVMEKYILKPLPNELHRIICANSTISLKSLTTIDDLRCHLQRVNIAIHS